MSYFTFQALLLSVLMGLFQTSHAAEGVTAVPAEITSIQHEWASLYYADDFGDAEFKQLQALARRANRNSADHPGDAAALTWDAIVLSTLAEKKGGLGALSLVKEAKLKLEQAEAIDGSVLHGSVYASLGTLYAKVPGWPISFGNERKAREYLERALALNPQGLDVNYFYADFLADNDEPQQALIYVEKALSAPTLEGRPVADMGRRQQAARLRDRLVAHRASLD
jgi:tetratricopeptide (TPR) repeat protein